MRTDKDVEAYLLRYRRPFRPFGDGRDVSPPRNASMFMVEASHDLPPSVVRVEPPLVIVRSDLGEIVEDAKIFRKLLESNATSLLHTSYGLEGNHAVLSSALQLENLDFNELEATLDEMEIALAEHARAMTKIDRKK